MPKKRKSSTSSCISNLVHKGYPQKQAVAISLNKGKKKSRKRK